MARDLGVYRDRDEAGDVLASHLGIYRDLRAVVLAIPNGGVPVGIRLCANLDARLALVVVRKLHIPWNHEAGFGAVAPDGTVAFNEPIRRALGLSDGEERDVIEAERDEIRRRMAVYGACDLPTLRSRVTILVDDGLASGFSMMAAARYVRNLEPAELVVAVPTASRTAVELVRPHVDRVVCPNIRGGPVFAVADAYRRWRDVEDAEVVAMLEAAKDLLETCERT